jgi:hypothetical protein
MSTKYKIPHSILRDALNLADQLPPLAEKKNPIIAALLGCSLGALGLGLYLRNWTDVLMPCLILLFLVILSIPTAGLPLLFIPIFWGVYGYRRVSASNRRLADRDDNIIEAEIVVSRPPAILLPSQTQTSAQRHMLNEP